jgi:hypothetical protein
VRAIDAAMASVAAGAGGPQPEPELAAAELAAGTAVVIGGLVGAPQHNGKGGVVEGFDAAKGRYVVRVIGKAKPLRVKLAKLQLASAPGVLVAAAQQGDVAALGRLLDGGVDPNVLVQSDLDDSRRPGQKVQITPLVTALYCKQEAAARLLLARGADPNLAISTGMAPLIAAANTGNLAGVQLLLTRRVALDCAVPANGFTAFHYACSEGHADVAAALVQAGCDTTLRVKSGRTGREKAMQQGHTAVVRAIDAAAALP